MKSVGRLVRPFFYLLWTDLPGWVVFFSIFWLVSVFSVATDLPAALFLGGGTALVLVTANAFFSWASAASPIRKEAPPALRYVLPVLCGVLYLLLATMIVPFVELLAGLTAPEASQRVQGLTAYVPIGCLILSRFGAFPRHHGVRDSVANGAGTAMGFTAYLLFIGTVTQALAHAGKNPFYGAVLGGALLGGIAYAGRQRKKSRPTPRG